MTKDRNNQDLMDALTNLETSLETPFVPGELESWSHNVKAAVEKVDPLLKCEIDDVHEPELQEIGSEDPGLLQRVKEMRQKDEQSLENLDTLRRTVEKLDELAAELEPDETKFKTQLDELVRTGLRFVIHVRSQEVALRTWLQEAFDRDRGTVD